MSHISLPQRIAGICCFLICGLMAMAAGAQESPPEPESSTSAAPLEEVTVTATRRAENLQKVPISVSAFTSEEMQDQGLKDISQIGSFTPGIVVSTGGTAATLVNIRGIVNAAGASTTGIYIDDTPIQVRQIGTSAGNAYPEIFDIDRVEILRGPQGTLFGAGSEGGTVRFIQSEPNLEKESGYARSEVSTNEAGGMSYEGGYAYGAPIVTDTLGFRASVFFRRDGGYVNEDPGTWSVIDPTGKSGVGSMQFSPTGIGETNADWEDTLATHFAMTWKPVDGLEVTPSFSYQHQYKNVAVDSFLAEASDRKSDEYVTPEFVPTIDATHLALNAPLNQPYYDGFQLASLKASGDTPIGQVISDTSFFNREMNETLNYTTLYEFAYAGRSVPAPGDDAISEHWNRQNDLTQEIRLQSTDPNAFVTYTTGLFFTEARQYFQQLSSTNFIPLLNPTFAAVNNGAPFGPGYDAFVNWYGEAPFSSAAGTGVSNYDAILHSADTQYAGFAEVDVNLTKQLKLTGGLRYSIDRVSYDGVYSGPSNNLNAPHGLACVPGTGTGTVPCDAVAIGAYAPGTGPYALDFINGGAGLKEHALTPKAVLDYQLNDNNMVYVSAAKGFRPGGAQLALPANCNAQLVSLGFVNAEGQAASPLTYKSDSVWSYEIGAKNRLFGDTLVLDSSVYVIKWNDIQSTVSLNSCLQSVVENEGSATARGFDLHAEYALTRNFIITENLGYNETSFDKAFQVGGETIYTEGSAIPGSGSPWISVLSGRYDFPGFKGIPAFVRADYSYSSKQRRTGATDPLSAEYVPGDPVQSPIWFVNARAGLDFDSGFELSLFINNLTDNAPYIGLTHFNDNPIYTASTLTPRTIGITGSYRY